MTLKARQQRFCQEYLVDLNGSRAAVRAGYSASGAGLQASRLLANDKVSLEIAKLRAGREKRTGITADGILELWGKIAFDDKFKVSDRLHAADSAAKHLGMFTNKELDAEGFRLIFSSVLDE